MAAKDPHKEFTFTGKQPFRVSESKTTLKKALYSGKSDYRKKLAATIKEIDDLQNMVYAHDRHAMLIIFQAMDALWKARYEGIQNLEKFMQGNGTQIVKFFLNLSKEEQTPAFSGQAEHAIEELEICGSRRQGTRILGRLHGCL